MSHLDEAAEILDSVKGTPLSLQQRKKLSIELAALMIEEATRTTTSEEKETLAQLSRLMTDPEGKAFTTAMTDQCFRAKTPKRVADQLIYLLNQCGVPRYLNWVRRLELFAFKTLGSQLSQFLIPFATRALRKETSRVILPGESVPLNKHLQERRKEGVRQNLNHLGEAVLTEAEAKKRLHTYLEDLKNPEIDYMSVKISTIFSQINLLAFDETVEMLAERLRLLYRAAMKHKTGDKDKFVNLDMEEYRDLQLTVSVFRKVLDEPEFEPYSAGIVLQAYLPDSHHYQKELTEWAKARIKKGGGSIKIRIVKGANLAMEQFEASLKGWHQAPYTAKVEVDANFKRMVMYGCIPENARAVHLGIASHNLFDLAFAMLLRAENQVEPYTSFEMLEGMADHIRRVVQKLTGDMLLYCPVATKQEFQHAIAYLIRRLDENTGADNFLRHVFHLKPGTESWENQVAHFSTSCDEIETASLNPRRTQNRQISVTLSEPSLLFENEPDTDYSLLPNRKWAEEIAHHWKNYRSPPIPLVIQGKECFANEEGKGFDPSNPSQPIYAYAKANREHINQALECAKANEASWGATTILHRSQIFANVAQKLREKRGELIGAMLLDGGKTFAEADSEVSEAIDFADYYRRQMEKIGALKDIRTSPKGTCLVISPWNFPCAIPASGLVAALLGGNCVLFKPASDTVLVAWHLVNAFWEGGIPKEVLQFIPCDGAVSGSELIQDPRVNCAILTGGTETAKKILKLRPDIDLSAETGGKNSIIITALSDRDLAIKDLIQSAFGHAGQKCSAAALAILEAEVYDDPHFKKSLRDAAASLKVGPAYDLSTKVNPLIHPPTDGLKRALTTLEPGEEWLLQPKQDPDNPCLWSPGIKLNVQPGSFTHMTELFGPVLGLMRAKDLNHAIELANGVPYGLTAGLQSLDEREQTLWTDGIEAGNLYINRTITGAIVRRQPFGGYKASSFGGGSKAGGPSYLRHFIKLAQINLPKDKLPVNEWVNSLTAFLDKIELTAEELGLWTASVANYTFCWKRLRQDQDPTKIVGQDNWFCYLPRKNVVLRIEPGAKPLDALRICAAALTCNAELEVSFSAGTLSSEFHWVQLLPILRVVDERESVFLSRVEAGEIERVRILTPPTTALYNAAAESATHIMAEPVLANGRLELLHYLRELSVSIDYHRYGNLGLRDGELRKPIL